MAPLQPPLWWQIVFFENLLAAWPPECEWRQVLEGLLLEIKRKDNTDG